MDKTERLELKELSIKLRTLEEKSMDKGIMIQQY